jgi:hypothetical protein
MSGDTYVALHYVEAAIRGRFGAIAPQENKNKY